MIVKLGRTAIKYNTTENDDFLIISCIPTSSMSPDKPTFIRTAQDLRLNFGEEFPEYSYLVELLEQGVTLYVMGPTEETENENQENYVKLEGYADGFWIDQDVKDYNLAGYLVQPLPTSPSSPNLIYRVIDNDGIKIGGPTGKYSEMVYVEGWIDIQDLPQNTWVNTSSQNNRDTLRICSDSLYCHPKYGAEIPEAQPYNSEYYIYRGGEWQPQVGIWDSPKYVFGTMEELQERVMRPKEEDLARIDNPVPLEKIRPEKVDNEEESLAFLVEGRGIIGEDQFVVLGDVLYGNVGDGNPLREYVREVIPVSSVDEFLVNCQTRGWRVEGKYIIPRDLSAKVTYFYKHPTLKITPAWEKSQELIASYTIPIIDYSSKTIGSEGPESWISVKAENLEGEGIQRITISRYEYTEVFEGSWMEGSLEEERLDYQISKGSKLVNAIWHGKGVPPEGEWTLRGATGLGGLAKEKTLEFIFKGEVGIDFFLSYGDLPQTSLLGYALEKGCQVLVQNDGEDYKENVKDVSNHLLFFYRPMLLYGVLPRPAWYIWLRGLLSDIYSDTAENVSYDSPAPDYDEDNELCKDLKRHRSNYLTASGLDLFYRSYVWGGDKETAFARFVLGKITRELEKNKWNFIGQQPGGQTIPAIKRILERVKNNFGIIRSIEITDYDFYYRQNLIELSLETRISDLPDHDITLDITLNYNK